ncbi:MAG TPA: class I SAM-dependent methyltransferase [Anaerolineaceae bacterium]|nr:class I SAM-dependent methyltransferase [Anaerolineaceae bacterium]
MSDADIKRQVREFYDQVGWQVVSEGQYQNARYEDLRPVSREYIHRCHLRVGQYLKPEGNYLLDAGSGPIQYPEYLTYSEGYRYRVCADISIVALQEARKRLGAKALCVVADVANLPFRPEAFDGVVSLHTLHHLPPEDHRKAYFELERMLAPGSTAVVVNGWTQSALMTAVDPLVRLAEWLQALRHPTSRQAVPAREPGRLEQKQPNGTYTLKFDADWLKGALDGQMTYEIRSWRTVHVRFLRALIHSWLGGHAWLCILYRLEERFPRFMGEKGQYPLIVIRKSGPAQH